MRVLVLLSLFMIVHSLPAFAQGTSLAFGGLKHDASLPVEVAADSLKVDQSDGSAVFSGNVLVSQGEMKLAASSVRVEYVDGGDTGQIEKMLASGGVTFTNGLEAAEAQEATYTLTSSAVVMTGDVILTQGSNAITGERLVIDLENGTGNMEGRVRTIFQTGDSN